MPSLKILLGNRKDQGEDFMNEQEKQKRDKIRNLLYIQKALFNPDRAKKDYTFQFNFRELEGLFIFHLMIKNRVCIFKEGKAEAASCKIITDYNTWDELGKGLITASEAFKKGRLQIEGSKSRFTRDYKKLFSGYKNYKLRNNLFLPFSMADSIKKVLVVSASSRGREGTTQLLTEHFIKGAERGGAKVETLVLSEMKIESCTGCFSCWIHNNRCVHHHKDDMKLFLEKFAEADLLVWATPIYSFHCTPLMKNVLDRLFVLLDPHIVLTEKGQERHPMRVKRVPHQMLLACTGYSDFHSFGPLRMTLKMVEERLGMKMLAELLRPGSLSFLTDNMINKRMLDALTALERAGEEVVLHKKVSSKSKRLFEQKVIEKSRFMAIANFIMDKMIQDKKLPFTREVKQEGKPVSLKR